MTFIGYGNKFPPSSKRYHSWYYFRVRSGIILVIVCVSLIAGVDFCLKRKHRFLSGAKIVNVLPEKPAFAGSHASLLPLKEACGWNVAHITELVKNGFDDSEVTISTWVIKNTKEQWNNSKIVNSKNYCMKTYLKPSMICPKRSSDQLSVNICTRWEWFRNQVIGCHINWKRGMWKDVWWRARCFLNGRKSFLHRHWRWKIDLLW